MVRTAPSTALWTVRWTLRQRRYAALALAMFVVALICVGAGTFEVHRYHEKRHDNSALTSNAHAAATPIGTGLVPIAGTGPAPGASAIRYRTVTATGTYLTDETQFYANQSQGGHQGFWVVTPLRTPDGLLLVARGFVAATTDETRPADVAAPPAGEVRATGRLETAQSGDDQYGRLGHGEIMTVNAGQQARRLGAPVFGAFVLLDAGQPGTAGLGPLPKPDLSNPSGGAAEWQLLSYVVQWYVFAVLALLVPFLVSRSEVRDARRRYLGIDPDAREIDDEIVQADRPALAGRRGDELVVRAPGTLARAGSTDPRWTRAARLADRYGRSLGEGAPGELAPGDVVPAPSRPPEVVPPSIRRSDEHPHRSVDAYHGDYNDYLWRLALADGGLPDVFGPADEPTPSAEAAGDIVPKPVLRPDGTVDEDVPDERPGSVP